MSQELELVDHLSELRKRILIVGAGFLAFFIIGFIFVEQIYQFLVKDLDTELALLGPTDILWIYFKIAGVVAISLTIPLAAYHTWRFVLPALEAKQRKATLMLIPALFLLFIIGLGFGYSIVFPTVLSFLQGLSNEGFQMFYTTEKYFNFLFQMTVPFGILFEMPVVVLFLTALGILNPTRLKKSRKICYFAFTVLAVVLTPPDFLSDILVLVCLVVLFEISITISTFVYKKREKKLNLDY
ncbi:twin-arginine translocase subunit TatC [Pseudalkalibacillus salsuginis]|uniref:twin-arginine translocase subunit TatC n=1 Tax=Pseudalkalibacillus salsuginis TaxID=2910972 RepID=UPI001CD5DD3C|nr:twin-arginine translocase subunit TatC [Pseudalkalibacillus salsuginis]MCF6409399.1 twin-arginine translocase subunit TatC [Pseudalkalibacillus salsuginis]